MSVKAMLIGGGLLLLLLLLGWVCFTGNKIKRELVDKYPPPGQMVDIGGFHLHINCQGEHEGYSPTVVMEAAEFSLSWASVQPEVAKFVRVCTYDRAGLGWSEASPNPRTVANIVEELHTLLERAGVEPPYVLVGHSKGGMCVRMYAHEYPNEVVGMVLVDSSHEEQELRFPEPIKTLNQKSREQTVGLLKLIKPLNWIGLLTPFLARYSDSLLGTIPEGVREMGLAVALSDKFFQTVIDETKILEDHFAEVREAKINTLGDMPLIVLTAVDQFDALEGQVSEKDVEQLKTVVRELQTELTELSSNRKLVPVEGSGHFIQVDHPQVVIDAICEVIESVQP
jgi:pimeloyl-ACP methyl ester carboxylesterase